MQNRLLYANLEFYKQLYSILILYETPVVNMSTTTGMEAKEILNRLLALAGISEGLPVGFILEEVVSNDPLR